MAGDGREVEGARARLAQDLGALAAAGSPVVVLAADGARLLWASPSGRSLFGLPGSGPASLDPARHPVRRFAELAAGLAPAEGQRLERVRLPAGRRVDLVTLACRRLADGVAEPALLLVGPAPKGAPGGQPVPDLTVLLGSGDVQPAPAAATGTPEALVARAGGRPFLRFIWQCDADGRFGSVTPDLAAAVGALAPAPGEAWPDLLRRGVRDAAGAVGEALAAGRTFNGLDVLWPVDDGRQLAPVSLAGVPVAGPDRPGAGFRGFGLMRLTAAVPAEETNPETGRQEMAQEAVHDVSRDADEPAQPAAVAVAVDAAPSAAAPPAQDAPVADAPVQASHAPADPARNGPPRDEAAPDEHDVIDLAEAPAAPAAPAAPSAGTVVPFAQIRGSAQASLADPKVVPLRAAPPRPAEPPKGLSRSERHAFREIARALGARIEGEDETDAEAALPPAAPVAGPLPSPAAGEGGTSAPAVPPEVEAALEAAALAEARVLEAERPAADAAPADVPPEPGTDGDDAEDAAEQTPPPAVPAGEAAEPVSDLARHADALFDRLPVGVLVCRGEVPIVMNRTLLDLVGWESIDDFYRDGGLPRLFRGRSAESLPAGQDGSTVALATREGEIVAVDARFQTIQWDGLPATLMTFRRAIDVELTPRLKAAELELRRREAEARELHAILDTATDGVIVLDVDGRILSINRSGEALFGYDQREVAGETFISLLAPDSHATALDYLEGLKSNGVASVLNDGREVVGRVRQGGRIPLFMTLGAISREPEIRFCAVLRDITPWKKAESDLTEAKRAAEVASSQKSDFLAKISHEIRTPLSAIIGFAEVMIEERFGPVGNERYLEYLRDIHASGGHVISLVNDLLDLSKIEAGRFELSFGSVDVNEIVARSVSLMQPQASTSRVVVRTALAARLPRVVADERSLRQIVLNLLSNAVKFTDPGGQVIVSTALTDRGEIAIRVRDTGIGMTEKEVETALEPFRQLATARRAGGTGLGLPLTKALVEANRATLTIRSAKDSGTLVEVLFPTNRVLAE